MDWAYPGLELKQVRLNVCSTPGGDGFGWRIFADGEPVTEPKDNIWDLRSALEPLVSHSDFARMITRGHVLVTAEPLTKDGEVKT